MNIVDIPLLPLFVVFKFLNRLNDLTNLRISCNVMKNFVTEYFLNEVQDDIIKWEFRFRILSFQVYPEESGNNGHFYIHRSVFPHIQVCLDCDSLFIRDAQNTNNKLIISLPKQDISYHSIRTNNVMFFVTKRHLYLVVSLGQVALIVRFDSQMDFVSSWEILMNGFDSFPWILNKNLPTNKNFPPSNCLFNLKMFRDNSDDIVKCCDINSKATFVFFRNDQFDFRVDFDNWENSLSFQDIPCAPHNVFAYTVCDNSRNYTSRLVEKICFIYKDKILRISITQKSLTLLWFVDDFNRIWFLGRNNSVFVYCVTTKQKFRVGNEQLSSVLTSYPFNKLKTFVYKDSVCVWGDNFFKRWLFSDFELHNIRNQVFVARHEILFASN